MSQLVDLVEGELFCFLRNIVNIQWEYVQPDLDNFGVQSTFVIADTLRTSFSIRDSESP